MKIVGRYDPTCSVIFAVTSLHIFLGISLSELHRQPQHKTDGANQEIKKQKISLTFTISLIVCITFIEIKKKQNSSTEVMASWHDAPLFLETGVFVSSYAVIVSKTGHCTCFMNPVISLSVHFFCRWGKDILTDLLIMSSLLLWSRNNELWKWDLIARTE